jgi:hypothetical protein
MKCAYWKNLVNYYLHGTEKNLHVTDIRNWNIIDAIKSVAVILNSIQVLVNVLSMEALLDICQLKK